MTLWLGSVDARLFFVLVRNFFGGVVRIKLVLGGKEYSASSYSDLANMTIEEIRTIKERTGMTPSGLRVKLMEFAKLADSPQGVAGFDEMAAIDVCAALVYLLMARSGEKVTWADVERVPLLDLAAGFSIVEDEPAAAGNGVTAPAVAPDLVSTNGVNDRG